MKVYKIKVNGKTYKVELESVEEIVTKKDENKKEEIKKVEEKPTVNNTSSGNKSILAPLQGTLTDVKVKIGDTVKKGQVVCIIEAMKLENEVSSPFDGEVVNIVASKGKNVASKELLIELK